MSNNSDGEILADDPRVGHLARHKTLGEIGRVEKIVRYGNGSNDEFVTCKTGLRSGITGPSDQWEFEGIDDDDESHGSFVSR